MYNKENFNLVKKGSFKMLPFLLFLNNIYYNVYYLRLDRYCPFNRKNIKGF